MAGKADGRMPRRDFMKWMGAAGMGAMASPLFSLAQQNAAPKPNIIYIMVDDLGYRDLGCYGQEKIATPNIDRMARQGMRFTECYSGSSVCAPARSVLMTGQHTGHTRLRNNRALVGGLERRGGLRVSLQPEDVTVAEVLQQAGYTTGLSGKWGIGERGSQGTPGQKGFDEWYGYLNQARAHNHWPGSLWHNGEQVELPANSGGERGQMSHHLFTDFCLDFVRRQKDEPFFYYLAWTLPHWPLVMSDLGQYAEKDWPDKAKAYAAMVTLIDRDVGRILDLLGELGLDEDTLVLFCSDNGASSRWEGLFDSVGQMRGKKGSLMEGGIRVPMIARWPGHVAEGVVDDTPWYFTDFLPTAADVAGAGVPAGVDGVSVLPTLLGRDQDLDERYMYWERPPLKPERPLSQAARRGRWKARRNGLDGRIRLHDLSEDHVESGNLANEHPEVVRQFAEFMDAAHEHSPHWPHRGCPTEQ
jgi:arylsulfatase A-like enzyme